MNIWYAHHYGGGPGIGAYDRPLRLAQSWLEQGHSATVFIAAFHHLLERREPLPPEMTVEGVRYVCLPARPYSGNGVARLLNMWDFCKGLNRLSRRPAGDLPRPDAIIVSSPHPFAIFAGWRLARRFGARLVFEIRDIWPLSITEITGTSKWHPFVLFCRFTEWFALTRCDLVASVLPRADLYLAERGYAHKRFVWVPNGVAADGGQAPTLTSDAAIEAARRLDAWRGEGRATIIYTGSIGAPNAVDLLVQALAHGEKHPGPVRFAAVIVGSGDQLGALRAYALEHGLTNIHFTGRLAKGDALGLLPLADIGYAGLRNIGTLFRYGISPNKIIDYFQAGLPVYLPIAPCGDPVSESGGGIAEAAETPQAVWNGLTRLMASPPEPPAGPGAATAGGASDAGSASPPAPTAGSASPPAPTAGRDSFPRSTAGRDYILRKLHYGAIAKTYALALGEA